MNSALPDLKAIFGQAVEITSAAERAAFLDESCGQDPALRAEVEGLLAAAENAGSFMRGPAVAHSETQLFPTLTETPGTVIGPYKLLQQIGEGGMGVVFMAEQTEPIQRTVALKIIKPGMDTRQVIARFEAERQALAMMDHPNIAKVLDAGTTDSGRPYFVMELVKGVPITKYCDEKHLPLLAPLELFMQVCQAVQHAHQKGIIHRDIKPNNVLVAEYDNHVVPKVIDFGVAKATAQKLTERTMFTEFGQVIGTVEYMSPEQAKLNQLDIDTRSDIYSLGVLLYELLTGSTPFEQKQLREAAFDEMLRIIREEEPPKPSTRLSTSDTLPSIAANRHTEPQRLSKEVSGELDWIVMKALEKDRNRRYETASAFAADIERHLRDEPVQAGPPSAAYRFRKFARRNKRMLISSSFVAIALLAGTLVSLWQAVRAIEFGRIAENERNSAQQSASRAVVQGQIARQEADRANEAEQTTRHHLYAAHIKLAEEAWEGGRIAQLVEFLQGEQPQPDRDDQRSFEWYYLWGLCHRSADLSMDAEHGIIRAVAFAPDGKTFAAGANDGAIMFWDVTTGRQQATLAADAHGVSALVFLTDGKTCASGNEAGTVKLWNVPTRQCLAVLEGHTDRIASIAVSADGRLLATGSADHTAKLWDLETRRPLFTLKTDEGQSFSAGVRSVAFAPDGATLATGSGAMFGEGQVQLWDAATGERQGELVGHKDRVYTVAFSPDGETLATGGSDTTVRLWDRATLRQKAILRGHASAITSLAFFPDGQKLVSASGDTVKLWSVPLGQLTATLKGHGKVQSLVLAPDGMIVGTGSSDGTAKLWNPSQNEDFCSLQAHSREVRGIAFSPDSKLLSTVSFADHTLKIWDVATGREQRTLERDVLYHAVAFSSDGKTLAAAGSEIVKLWDLHTGQQRSIPNAHSGGTWTVAFSPNGSLLATGGQDKAARLWDCTTCKQHAVLEGHRDNVQYVAFSRDGKTLATASWDKTVKLWDVSTGEELTTLQGHAGYVTCLAFSPDGKTLASGSYDGTAKLWEIDAGRERLSLSGHTMPVWAVDFTSDGRTLATAAWDGTVKLWDPLTGQERLTLRAGAEPIWSMAFSPDRRNLAAARRNGVVNLWRTAGNDMAEAVAEYTEAEKLLKITDQKPTTKASVEVK